MFALEIEFHDGVSKPETLLVRRTFALIGSMENAHVVIEDMKTLSYHLRLIRDVGRTFRCAHIRNDTGEMLGREVVYEDATELNLGPITLEVSALDSDVIVRDAEAPDRAGVRIMRQVSVSRAPRFPAALVVGPTPVIYSFDKNHPIHIGRSRQCQIRLDSTDVSAQHARLGFDGNSFWIEDLGSTNGTFVNNQQVAGKLPVPAAVPIILGRDTTIMGLTSESQLRSIEHSVTGVIRPRPVTERKYPVLFSTSEVVRPARVVVPTSGVLNIGRDPTSDMWLGAPHVSRMHCSVTMTDDGVVIITDRSTNGTAYDSGILRKGESVKLSSEPTVLDFGAGITVAICFNESHEQAFISSQGGVHTFTPARAEVESTPSPALISRAAYVAQLTEEERQRETIRRTTFFHSLRTLYADSGFRGKLVVLSSVVAIVVISIVVFALIMPLLR